MRGGGEWFGNAHPPPALFFYFFFLFFACDFSSSCFWLFSQRGSVKWQVDQENTCSLHPRSCFAALSSVWIFLSVSCSFATLPPFSSLALCLSLAAAFSFCCVSFFCLNAADVAHRTQKCIKKRIKGNVNGSQVLPRVCVCVSVCSCVCVCVF